MLETNITLNVSIKKNYLYNTKLRLITNKDSKHILKVFFFLFNGALITLRIHI